MKMKSRKGLSILLAFVLVFAMSATPAFAAWPSFQNGADNNGVISTATPITDPQTVLRVGLPTNDPYNTLWSSNSVWNGVDTTSVISGGKAYTLYNGGVTNGTMGGARLGITDLATGDTSSKQITGGASNGFLLSTPVIVGSDIYAAVTGIVAFDASLEFNSTNWTATPPTGLQYIDGLLAFDAGATGFVESTGYDIIFSQATNTFTMTSDINTGNSSSVNYSLALKNSSGTTYTIVNNATAPGTGTSIITYNGASIPAGSYKLIVTIGTNTNLGKFYGVTFSGNGWGLYKVANFATNPVVSLVKDNSDVDISYQGQANTPITYDGTYLYWGIYGGTQSYYQLDVASCALATFAANDDFYYAGAAILGGYVYFGSDSGTLYKRDISAFSTTGSSTAVGAGKIRSSVSTDGTDLYFTTQGTAGTGTVKKFNTALVQQATHALEANYISSSTPVISSNGYVYIGAYNGFTYGRVYALPTSLASLTNVYSGDPVQASPIVYFDADEELDYVYFTTNSGTGAGYCYSFNGSVGTQVWTAGGASGNRYAVQGFSSDNGYLVYGDDGGSLYIMH